jgi:molecular chaperone DnaK
LAAAPSPDAAKPAPPLASKTTTLPGGAAAKGASFLPGGGGRTLVFDPPPPDVGANNSALLDLASAWPSVPPDAAASAAPGASPVRIEAQAHAHAPPPPRRAPLLIDVTPHSLGVETAGGFCDVLIEANTPVPCDRSRAFATARDNQTTVTVRVSQGESKRFAENTCLGEVELSGIKAGPRGTTKIAVTFEIDADGILHVKARDGDTGHETTAHLQLVGAQSEPADLEAMRARQDAHPLVPLPR